LARARRIRRSAVATVLLGIGLGVWPAWGDPAPAVEGALCRRIYRDELAAVRAALTRADTASALRGLERVTRVLDRCGARPEPGAGGSAPDGRGLAHDLVAAG
jgi:hypothetical protein